MLTILLASHSLTAQTKIGFTAGAAFGNVTVKSQGISASPKQKAGITAGIFANAPLSTNFSFQPALNFVQKGYIVKDETGTEKVSFNYLEVPLNFVYNTKKDGGFFMGQGLQLHMAYQARINLMKPECRAGKRRSHLARVKRRLKRLILAQIF